MAIKQISIFVQNRPGHLADVTEILKENNIKIIGLSLTEGNDFGIVRLIVDDVYKTEYLLKEDKYLTRIDDVLVILIDDQIGLINSICQELAKNNININYIYMLLEEYNKKLPLVIKTSDQEKTKEVIENLGISVISQSTKSRNN